MFNLEQIKVNLKQKGWSYRAAGLRIGKSYQWICQVLNGQKKSAPVLKALSALPPNEPRRKTKPFKNL